MADLERMGIWRLRELARQTHPDHVDEAARVFVRLILEMEVERRTLYEDHERLQGYHSHSPMAPGFAPGGTDIAREPLAALYDRGIRYHEDHEAARRWIVAARLAPRNLLAVMIQARKLDRRVQGEWGASYDQIAASIQHYARQLGFSVSGRVIDCIGQDDAGRPMVRNTRTLRAFKDGQAIKDAAKAGKVELILQAKAGVL
ncbi:hypothetical protein HOP60_09835 [Halomonas daqingensis]|uniref:Molecular chaperone DnaJ n=1 Tax=Billgrantia desiderata TaxID=52021 RepID=A0ABS9B4A9_9GAMM|nr:hypothetical protein [Halomonas desiderata]MCE8042453.1 hypothetical protein [Halomonas desiderata]MCE8047028.1 hypothetical protein [Halomonas desiderata]